MFAKSKPYNTDSHVLVASLGLAANVLAQGYKKPGFDYSWIIFLVVGLVLGIVVIAVKRKFSK